MNKTFHFSPQYIKRIRQRPYWVLLVVAVIAAYVLFKREEGPESIGWLWNIAIFTSIIALTAYINLRNIRPELAYAQEHTLAFQEDYMVFIDKGVRIEVYYEAIISLTLAGWGKEPNLMIVERGDGIKEQIYGYEDFSSVIKQLVNHLNRNKIWRKSPLTGRKTPFRLH